MGVSEVQEEERLAALRRYGVLDSPEEVSFDEIAQAVARFCGAPMAAISLVDETRQWFKAQVGLNVRETPRELSFCQHAMLRDDLYVVADAAEDDLFSTNALVTGAPHVRFYAGASIRSPEGLPLGALCVIDVRPRPEGLTAEQAMVLGVLARQVEAQLELRRIAHDQKAVARAQAERTMAALDREQRLVSALDSAEVGLWDWDVASGMVVGNTVMARLCGLIEAEAERGLPLAIFFQHIHPADLPWLTHSIYRALETGAPFREEYRLALPGRDVSWASSRGRCIFDEDGKPARFRGIAIDITERKRTEQKLREADIGRELAMQAARLGRFDHNPSTGERFYDARALEITGLTPEEAQDLNCVLARIHPEDAPELARRLAEAQDPGRIGPFEHIYRLIQPRTGQERWIRAAGRSQFSDGVCTRFMGVFEDVTEARLAEEHRRMLTNELNHRMKNTLAIVMSLVDSSLRNAPDPAVARADLTGRIRALSGANDLLTAENWSAASVPQIVDGVVGALSIPRDRLELDGGPVRLGPKPALQLALALHELATNAVKYGALSNDTGRLTLRWGLEEQDGAQMFTFS
jgi:PAS domain S-box-containing protein